jgi:uncharacterized protein (DUF488 family)
MISNVPTLYTVGHSNHSLEHFLELLRSLGIEVVVDVRSFPFSRYAPQFNQEGLNAALERSNMTYLFMGSELGGRPHGDEFYDEDDHVLYARVARENSFRRGIQRVADGLDRYKVALMCSEEDPTGCHRRLLVARVLSERGVRILHIRGDAVVETEEEVRSRERSADEQIGLFDDEEEKAWRSIRSVSRRRAPENSSRS